jgi:lauroyl/myristoyl acyltransferase
VTPLDARPLGERVVVGMFHTSPRLRHVIPLLRPLSRRLGEELLAGAAIVDGLFRGRFREAHAWAAAQPGPIGPPWRIALALLANHGRFCAEEAMLGASTTARPAPDVVVEGAENLPAPGHGAILLGFHLGPPRVWFHLRTLGYAVRLGGALVTSMGDSRWNAVIDAGDIVYLPGGPAPSRLAGLYQLRELLRDGALVSMAAEGPFGREAFRLELPGGPLIVRAGWLALRRLTQAPTFPMLAHRDGRRRVIVVSPPLPPPVADLGEDKAQCRAALVPLLEAYVRRYPAQCRYLAFPPWPTAPGPARRDAPLLLTNEVSAWF